MGKEARIKAARKNERGTMPGAWALNSKNNFRRRTIRRISAVNDKPSNLPFRQIIIKRDW